MELAEVSAAPSQPSIGNQRSGESASRDDETCCDNDCEECKCNDQSSCCTAHRLRIWTFGLFLLGVPLLIGLGVLYYRKIDQNCVGEDCSVVLAYKYTPIAAGLWIGAGVLAAIAGPFYILACCRCACWAARKHRPPLTEEECADCNPHVDCSECDDCCNYGPPTRVIKSISGEILTLKPGARRARKNKCFIKDWWFFIAGMIAAAMAGIPGWGMQPRYEGYWDPGCYLADLDNHYPGYYFSYNPGLLGACFYGGGIHGPCLRCLPNVACAPYSANYGNDTSYLQAYTLPTSKIDTSGKAIFAMHIISVILGTVVLVLACFALCREHKKSEKKRSRRIFATIVSCTIVYLILAGASFGITSNLRDKYLQTYSSIGTNEPEKVPIYEMSFAAAVLIIVAIRWLLHESNWQDGKLWG